MNADQITVVTCTLGDSPAHLSRSLTELRQFTSVPFRQLVSDDGTADRSVCDRQRSVCEAHGAEWCENPGPTFGISYNLNSVFGRVQTPWAFLIEDAVRPTWGWLETALDALKKVGPHRWGPRKKRVGAIGISTSFEDWHLACARALPHPDGDDHALNLEHFFDRKNSLTYESFWGSARCPHWNDGLWCWKRMEPDCYLSCLRPEADHWPEVIQRTWRQPILRREMGGMVWRDSTALWRAGYQHTSGWPVSRGVGVAPMGASAWCLVNMEAWREVGGWGAGATFYEAHLGVRMSRAGYLNVNCETPPWLHQSGLAFKVKDGQREPRIHRPTDGPDAVMLRDFGADGFEHGDLGRLAQTFFDPGEIEAISDELKGVDLYYDPRWEVWL